MKEKSYVARLGALALVLTLMTTCLTGGTLVKFVTEVEGTATAAAWNFEAAGNGTEFTGIDMGRTAYEGDTIKATVLVPGTKGSFDIVLDGSGSEVGIDYSVTITAAHKLQRLLTWGYPVMLYRIRNQNIQARYTGFAKEISTLLCENRLEEFSDAWRRIMEQEEREARKFVSDVKPRPISR